MAPFFAEGISRCIFVNETIFNLIKNSLKFVPKGPTDNNNPASIQIMAWRQISNKTLSELMLAWFIDTYMQHQGVMS